MKTVEDFSKHMVNAVWILSTFIIAAMFNVVTAKMLMLAAYAERGYVAVGGEWILIIILCVLEWRTTILGAKRLRRYLERGEGFSFGTFDGEYSVAVSKDKYTRQEAVRIATRTLGTNLIKIADGYVYYKRNNGNTDVCPVWAFKNAGTCSQEQTDEEVLKGR